MDETLLFLQALYEFMKKRHIVCSFDHLPQPDCTFWEQITLVQTTEDHKTLEEIAAYLREDISDFQCIEKITALIASRGFNTIPRHDF